MSRRDIEDALKSLFGLRVSLGSIPRMEQTVSLALQVSAEEVEESVQAAAAANIDDTGWHEGNRRAVSVEHEHPGACLLPDH